MKRWISNKKEFGVNNKIDAFLVEIVEVCKKYGLSISHEDCHGAFEIEEYFESNIEWLMDATDNSE